MCLCRAGTSTPQHTTAHQSMQERASKTHNRGVCSQNGSVTELLKRGLLGRPSPLSTASLRPPAPDLSSSSPFLSFFLSLSLSLSLSRSLFISHRLLAPHTHTTCFSLCCSPTSLLLSLSPSLSSSSLSLSPPPLSLYPSLPRSSSLSLSLSYSVFLSLILPLPLSPSLSASLCPSLFPPLSLSLPPSLPPYLHPSLSPWQTRRQQKTGNTHHQGRSESAFVFFFVVLFLIPFIFS